MDLANRLAALEHGEPAENRVHRRAELVAQRGEELVLQPPLPLCFVASRTLALQEPFAFVGGLAFGRDVTSDADDALAVRVRELLAAFGDPHHAAIRTDRPVFDVVNAGEHRAGGRLLEARAIVGMDRVQDAESLAE